MSKIIFVNLAVADVPAATRFYEAIGFVQDPRFSNDRGSGMTWSDNIHVMLLDRDFYATFTPKRIIDPRTESGVLLALSFDDRAAVDAITDAALAAGGRELHDPEDEGFMYSRAFEDLDGHGWGPFTMDMAAAEAAHADGAAA
ncbi:lactoylglutathione lyase [Sphingomonas sp. Leaf24]|uniref:VOC family protein n=1 Tax=unclassified Sphingomonas TaxID=196159 RepID=UPI00070086B0|nr:MULTISPECIES: VOC family protein [unclassified Sphingomonas]KQM20342.1 lactoylglutathione lyase [Sphingomonas sp. Leaf5]KQM96205.1 lactoylglutathione lyase [Sphingomonas sp. Leaf24]